MRKVRSSLIVAWRLVGKHVAVVGGDLEAQRRVDAALAAGARVTVYATSVVPSIQLLVERGEVAHVATLRPEKIEEIDMVLATLADGDTARGLAAECRAAGVPVHVADVRALCDFWFPAVHQEGPVQIAVATNGYGPALAARLRDYLAKQVPSSFGGALQKFNQLRGIIKQVGGDTDRTRRMKWMTNFARSTPIAEMAALSEASMTALASEYQNGSGNKLDLAENRADERIGSITLVGAGPGDPGLLTVAARDALQTADLVISDRLVPHAILNLVQGELRIAPKLPGRAESAQEQIFTWALAALSAGKQVVRLKIGDPFVFGRGGEEVARFDEAGFPPRVIPGVSSALAAPALARVSVTERGVADRVVFCTGMGKGGSEASLPNYDPAQSLVLLMAVKTLPSICQRLLRDHDYPPQTPLVALESASTVDEKHTWGTVGEFTDAVRAGRLRAPAIVVIGACATEKQTATSVVAQAQSRIAR